MAHKRNGSNLSPDSIVKRLVSDPDQVPRLVAVAGWIGRAEKKSDIRLYLTPNFGTYLEIAASDVVDAAKIGDGDLSGTMIWVERDTVARLRTNETAAPREGYLEDEIAKLPIASTPAIPRDPFPPTWTERCWDVRFPKTWITAVCSHPLK